MSETPYRLDDKYLTGIWYDEQAGDFCEIARGAPGEYRVELINPENGNIYHEISLEDWCESAHQDFRQVSEEVVNYPVEFVEGAVRMMEQNDINDMAGVSTQQAIDLRWAREQIEISEK